MVGGNTKYSPKISNTTYEKMKGERWLQERYSNWTKPPKFVPKPYNPVLEKDKDGRKANNKHKRRKSLRKVQQLAVWSPQMAGDAAA